MNDKRLIEMSNMPLERRMLQAAATESAPPGACRRVLASLDLLMIAPTLSASVIPGASANRVVTKLLGWPKQWLSAGGVVLTLAGAAIAGGIVLQRTTPPPNAVATPSRVAPGVASPVRRPATVTHPTPDAIDAARTAEAPGELVATPRSIQEAPRRAAEVKNVPLAPSSSETTSAISIRDEIDLLDRARTAVRKGAPDAALGLLDEYLTRHPQGQLLEEFALVRVEALRLRGANERRLGPAAPPSGGGR